MLIPPFEYSVRQSLSEYSVSLKKPPRRAAGWARKCRHARSCIYFSMSHCDPLFAGFSRIGFYYYYCFSYFYRCYFFCVLLWALVVFAFDLPCMLQVLCQQGGKSAWTLHKICKAEICVMPFTKKSHLKTGTPDSR